MCQRMTGLLFLYLQRMCENNWLCNKEFKPTNKQTTQKAVLALWKGISPAQRICWCACWGHCQKKQAVMKRVGSSDPNKMLGLLCCYISSYGAKSPLFAQHHLDSSGVWFSQMLLYSAKQKDFTSISRYRICCFYLSSSGLLLCLRKVCFSHLYSSVWFPWCSLLELRPSLNTASQSSLPIPLTPPGMW